MELNTYFYNEKNQRIGSMLGMVPVTKGMMFVTKEGSWIVDEIQINLNNHDVHNPEELGFRVFCKKNI